MQIVKKIIQDYWLNKIAEIDTVLIGPVNDLSSASFIFKIDDEAGDIITTIAKGKPLSEFALLLSLFSVLIQKYYNRNTSLISSPALKINENDAEENSNPLFYYFTSSGENTLREYIKNCQKEIQETLKHREYDASLRDSLFARGVEVKDLLQFAFSYSRVNENISCLNDSLLQLRIEQTEDGKFEGVIHYNRNLFSDSFLTGMSNHFVKILKNFPQYAATKIAALQVITDQEQNLLLHEFSGVTNKQVNNSSIQELLLKQVHENGPRAAVICDERLLTYYDLEKYSQRLAAYLSCHIGIKPGDFVGVMMDYTELSIISFAAIIKAGGIYVPIDPSLPSERIQYIIEDSKCSAIIIHSDHFEKVVLYDISVFNIDLELKKLVNYPDYIPPTIPQSAPAYLMYTSGSTGKPKGVVIHQKGIVRLVRETNYIHINVGSRLLGVSNYAFDGSTFDIWGSLLNGATLVLVKKDLFLDLEGFSKLLIANHIDIMFITTALFNALVDKNVECFKSVKSVLFGGETVSVKHVKRFYELQGPGKLIHVYGPTENTTFSTFYPVDSTPDQLTVPIGKPIDYSHCYIFDRHMSLQPIDCEGELYVSGAGLSSGYLNDEELTRKRFIDHPFLPNEKLYKTGDICKWLSDGNMVIMGRADDQVKIRGYRVELGEIEKCISSYPGVNEVTVIAKNGNDDVKVLIAYFIADGKIDISNLRSTMLNNLPEYMVPAYCIQLGVLPLTRNGKVDKKRLLELGFSEKKELETIKPTNSIERQLLTIWERLLERQDIGITDVFFDIGGHSLKATQLISFIHEEMKVKIKLSDIFVNPTIQELAVFLKSKAKVEYSSISTTENQECYPLSSSQQRLWVLSQFEDGSAAYNMPGSINLSGNYDLALFQKSFDCLIERHEILRTIFKADKIGEVNQWILTKEEIKFQVDYKDLRKEKNKEEQVKIYIAADSYKSFDLETGPLLRASLFQLENEYYIFYFNMHHIISDGWSLDVLTRDVLSFYDVYKEAKEPVFEPLRIQYKDYSAWQLKQLEEELFKTHKDYWLMSLSGELPLLNLPSNKQRPRLKTTNGHGLRTFIDSNTSTKIKNYSIANGGSLFMGLLAGWNILMYRYTGQTDIVTGTAVAGREHGDLKDQIGFYVNTLALRNEIDPEESFDSFYLKLRDNTLRSYDHQQYPFDNLIEELHIQRDTSRSAVFDVMLVLQNNGEKIRQLDSMVIGLKQFEDLGYTTSKFDLELSFQEIGDQVSLRVVYNTDVYEGAMIEKLINHYKQLLHVVLEHPEEKIAQIDYLSAEEKQELLSGFNDTAVLYPRDKTLLDLFEEQVLKTPAHTAIVFEDQELSYQELDELSNQLAHYLQKNYTIQADDLIGIKQERSEWMVISILSVLKSGAAYVPIDPEYPKERISYIEKDTRCKVCLDELELDRFKENRKKYSKAKIPFFIQPSNLAYVIYTSGSTGNPKGVMIEHENVVRLFITDEPLFVFNDSDVWTLFHSYAFDFSVWELFGALLFGGKLVIVPKHIAQDTNSYLALLAKERVTVLNQTPSAFYNLSKAEESAEVDLQIRYVIFGGEALSPAKLSYWHSRYPSCALINMYGITETTVHTTFKAIEKEDIQLNRSNIGKAIPTVGCLVLDQYKKLVPNGVAGELYVGGKGVARGYLNREVLSHERFIAHPFVSGERLYRTGDHVKQLSNGDLEYLGRLDNQVKIRGYRIELGEIEQALLKNNQLESAIVIAKENGNREKELVAYITAKAEQNVSELRTHLKGILPDYMLPAYYVQLKCMPLTSNGKIDKKLLPDPEGLGLSSGVKYIAPRNEIEEKLEKIWETILQRQHIGVEDDFFALGGHSLKAVRLINEYQKVLSVKLSLKDLFTHTSIEQHVTLINASKKSDFVQIEKISIQESYPISDAQRRLWILSQFEASSVAYNMPGSINLEGTYDLELFQRSFDSLIERHEILRTIFKENESGEIRQWILAKEDSGFKINYKDFRKGEDGKEKVKEYIKADSYKPFDLERGPLLRASLLQIEDESFVFYFNMHHTIGDGWSMEVLTKDVLSYYEAYKKNKKPSLPELRIQYKDYSSWQLAQLEEESFRAHKEYWLKNLAGELPLLDLPSRKQRPRIKTNNGHGLSTYIDGQTTTNLKKYTEANGGSLFMSLLAVWNLLLYRYTGQKDIITGTPVAGREHADLEDQIGFYVNTLALRNEIDAEESFDSFYSKLKNNTLSSYDHQLYPFDRLVENLDLQRDTSRSAVFDVMLVLQNNGKKREGIELGSEHPRFKRSQILDLGYSTSKFDINITFQEVGDYLSLHLVYNSDVYEQVMLKSLIKHYKQLLVSVLSKPTQKISQIDYLSAKEKQELLVTFNDTVVAYPKDKTIIDLFGEQVTNTPDGIAVLFNEKKLSYKELDEESNQLAHYLQKHYKVKPDDLIVIKQERSEWMIISILAVLKSGGAYVPIDPVYPKERIEYIEKDTNCKVCIDKNELNKFKNDQKKYSKGKIASFVKSSDLAYVMYTSGSTGKPKGVMIEQKSVIRLVKNTTVYSFSSSDKLLSTGAITFDATTFEYWGPLLNGGQLVLCSQSILMDSKLLNEEIRSKSINIMWFTAGWLNQLVESEINIFSNLKTILAGGDKLSPAHIMELRTTFPELKIINGYGPTENTTFSITHTISDVTGNILIGKPISNTQIYILNESSELQPVGVIGEIYIGGDGLARGYLNNPELTEEKFIANPFKTGERLYKTGDFGRWLSDGNIEFMGRKDDQVKIRGYRIELGEIEHALVKQDAIKEAVVVVRENESKEKELIAYIVTESEQNIESLRAYLKNILPVYMLPTFYVQLDALPLNANGKIDKKSLPDHEGLTLSSCTIYVAPRNELEEELVKIWEEVLKRDRIGINDDFLVLGGHSLKAVRLSNEYQKKLAVKLSLNDLFIHTNIVSQAELINSSKKEEFIKIEKAPNQMSYPISDAQRRLWILSQFDDGSVAYNMPMTINIYEEVEIECLKSAVDATIDRHEILRTVFKTDEAGEVRQWIRKRTNLNFKLDYIDLRKEQHKEERIKEYVGGDSYKPFNLEEGALLRACLLQVENEHAVFYFNMHHIICDGWSMEVLFKNVFLYYESYKENKIPDIKDLRIQYKDYSIWQLNQLKGESCEAHKNYWLEHLSGKIPILDLPSTKQRPRIKTYNGRKINTYLNKEVSQKLKTYSRQQGGSLFMGLLASLNVLLHRYTGQLDLIIGSPIAGRSHADLEDQIGFYVNTLPLRNEVKPDESFEKLFSRIKQNTFNAYAHQMYPFDRLVEDLNLPRDTSRSAIFDVMLVLQNNGNNIEEFQLKDGQENLIMDLGLQTSKFDLLINVMERGDYLSFSIEYNTDVYDQEMIQSLLEHYKTLISKLLTHPEQAVGKINYLSEQEWEKLICIYNDTREEYSEQTVIEMFEEQVKKSPDKTALQFEENSLTYQVLNERSNTLARILMNQYGVSLTTKVGVMLKRSFESVISMIGVMKTGACYVPIDHGYPTERVNYIIENSELKIIIGEESLSRKHNIDLSHVIDIKNIDFENGEKNNPEIINDLNDGSYVIYTSGSTGKPKGVLQTHRMLSNLIQWDIHHSGIETGLKYLQYSSFSFDASLHDLYFTLSSGGSAYIIKEALRLDYQALGKEIISKEIEVLSMPFSALNAFCMETSIEELENHKIKYIVSTAEQLHVNGGLKMFLEINPKVELHNHYGPSETHVVSSYRMGGQQGNIESRASIGKPLSNSSIYILDQNLNPVPQGVSGELYIGGSNLAIGYLNLEKETNEKFVENLFGPGKLYKTGDQGYWRPDGNIVFIGRKDDQVKIRGYRIELGEIEHALQSHEKLEEVVVLANENYEGEKELVAYFTCKGEINTSELRSYLKRFLPEYMLPSSYVQLEAFPLTSNGKIDKKSLPNQKKSAHSGKAEYVAPRNAVEEKLVKIWEETLQRENIGIKDDFFELGGHSLKATKVVFRINKEFESGIKIGNLYNNSTIEDLSSVIDFVMNQKNNKSKIKNLKEIEL
jgi:tyrocidine synthetase-3